MCCGILTLTLHHHELACLENGFRGSRRVHLGLFINPASAATSIEGASQTLGLTYYQVSEGVGTVR